MLTFRLNLGISTYIDFDVMRLFAAGTSFSFSSSSPSSSDSESMPLTTRFLLERVGRFDVDVVLLSSPSPSDVFGVLRMEDFALKTEETAVVGVLDTVEPALARGVRAIFLAKEKDKGGCGVSSRPKIERHIEPHWKNSDFFYIYCSISSSPGNWGSSHAKKPAGSVG